MHQYLNRLIRAIKLEPALFEEVEADTKALPQALATVVLSSIAAGFAVSIGGGLTGWFVNVIGALLSWFVWAFLTYWIGTKLMPEPTTKSDLGELLRCTGFSAAPGIFQVVGIIPGLGTIARIVASLWMLIAFVIAVRQALDYTSTWRAVGVCLVGWSLMVLVNILVFFFTFGQFTL